MLYQSVYEGESIMTQYRILKLRSGEEIITKITGKQKGKMILERPMIFRTMMMHDGLGRPKEVTVLRNWTPNTNEIHAKIPEDYIATFLTPSMEAVKLYELEKDQEDRIESNIVARPEKPKPQTQDPMSLIEALIRLKDDIEDIEDRHEEMMDGDLQDELDEMDDDDHPMMNMVTMTMFFPPNVLSEMINNGLINPKELGSMLNSLNDGDKFSSLSDLYTGDREDPDVGSSWTDWSSNPEDYFSDDDKDNKKDNP